jgi:hypothetical protein
LCCACVARDPNTSYVCSCGKKLCIFHEEKRILKQERKCLQCIRCRKYVQAIFDRKWPRDINNLIMDFTYHCPKTLLKLNQRKNKKQQQALLEQNDIDYIYPNELL